MEIKIENKFKVVYHIDEFIVIDNLTFTNETNEESVLNYFILLTHYLKLDYKYQNKIIKHDSLFIRRVKNVGKGVIGKLNNISDVGGVLVGHETIKNNSYNTGITVIKPHPNNLFKEKVVGNYYSYNGFSKPIGLIQIEELGVIESDIVLTTTLNSFKIADFLVSRVLDENEDIAISTSTFNPLVLECNDGVLNKSRDRIISKENLDNAYNNLTKYFDQGSVGAGTGMICHGLKGGIGSSSRIIKIDEQEYTIGILLNTNFGSSNASRLFFDQQVVNKYQEESEEVGSVIGVFATDLPLNERQIKRVLKRMEIGIGLSGSYAGNGSGDVFVGFTTANKRLHYEKSINEVSLLSEKHISSIFENCCDATLEAVYNSMLYSPSLKGFSKTVNSIHEIVNLFDKLNIEIIQGENNEN